jgi:hypothetical protein
LDTAAPSTEISIAGRTQKRGRKDREVSKKGREHTRKDRKDRMEGENTTWHARENALGDAIGQFRKEDVAKNHTQPRTSCNPVRGHSRRDKEDKRQEGHEHDKAAPALGDVVAAETEIRQERRKSFHCDVRKIAAEEGGRKE